MGAVAQIEVARERAKPHTAIAAAVTIAPDAGKHNELAIEDDANFAELIALIV